MLNNGEIKVLGGSTGAIFAKEMCNYLGIEMGRSEVVKSANGNIFVKVEETVRGKDVYIVQSIGLNPNDEFTEILFWIDALKRASANSVTAVIPYFGYSKGDKEEEPRVSIRAKVCAGCIELAGADRIVTMDLHSVHMHGFFKKPLDNFFALPVLAEYVNKLDLDDLVVVSSGAGFIKQARKYADYFDTSLTIGYKTQRLYQENGVALEIVGNVRGKNALIVDDFTASGNTLVNLAKGLKERGAKNIYACSSHLLINQSGIEKIENSPIDLLISTNSVNNDYSLLSKKIKIVSVAPLFAEGILRMRDRKSISSLFEKIPSKVFEYSIL